MQFGDQVSQARDRAFELCRATADVGGGVGVARRGLAGAQAGGDFGCEGVLARRTSAVLRFDGVHLCVRGIGGSALQRLGPIALVAQLEWELSTIRVGGDHHAPGSLHQGAEFVDPVHAVNVVLEAEDDDVAVFGVHLNSADDKEVVVATEFSDLLRLPEEVVLGQADAVESGALREIDQVIGDEEAIVGQRLGVGVEVDEQMRAYVRELVVVRLLRVVVATALQIRYRWPAKVGLPRQPEPGCKDKG